MVPPPVYAVMPFAAMLLAIAVCPLWAPQWWESNRNKAITAAVLGLPLLAAYFVIDSVQFSHEPLAAIRRDRARVEPLRVDGLVNVVWLAAVVGAVALLQAPWRELVIAALAAASLKTTPATIRRANGFS